MPRSPCFFSVLAIGFSLGAVGAFRAFAESSVWQMHQWVLDPCSWKEPVQGTGNLYMGQALALAMLARRIEKEEDSLQSAVCVLKVKVLTTV